jgi:hypothetical protein
MAGCLVGFSNVFPEFTSLILKALGVTTRFYGAYSLPEKFRKTKNKNGFEHIVK